MEEEKENSEELSFSLDEAPGKSMEDNMADDTVTKVSPDEVIENKIENEDKNEDKIENEIITEGEITGGEYFAEDRGEIVQDPSNEKAIENVVIDENVAGAEMTGMEEQIVSETISYIDKEDIKRNIGEQAKETTLAPSHINGNFIGLEGSISAVLADNVIAINIPSGGMSSVKEHLSDARCIIFIPNK